MSYYDDEFYSEPNEFEMQVDEFKQSILKSVKDEFVSEMERLKTENAELQKVKKNFEQIKNDYRNKEHRLEIDRDDMVRKVRSERLSVLMKDFDIIKYKASSSTILPDKCIKCDENRKIAFKSPSGKDVYESCECSIGKRVYSPEEHICKEFKINRDGNKMNVWYATSRHDEDGYVLDSGTTFYEEEFQKGTKYEEIENYYSTFFRDKEECKKYCDWLTEKEKDKLHQSTIAPSSKSK